MQARAVFWTAPETVEVQNFELPSPQVGEVLLEAEYSQVSPGTERHWLTDDKSHAVLGTTFPFRPGYSFSGLVLELGEGVTGLSVGDRVVHGLAVTGAHSSHTLAPAEQLFKVPDSVPLEEAVFFMLGQTACHTVRLAEITEGDTVAVVGQGPIGQLAAQVARTAGASDIVVLDVNPVRLAQAQAAGFTKTINPATPGELDAFIQETGGAEKVIDLSASAAGVNTALSVAKPLGRVILSTATMGPMEIAYGDLFVKGLTVIGSFVNVRPEESTQDIRDFLNLLAERRLDLSQLLTPPHHPETAPELYRRVLDHDPELFAPSFAWNNKN